MVLKDHMSEILKLAVIFRRAKFQGNWKNSDDRNVSGTEKKNSESNMIFFCFTKYIYSLVIS